MVKAGPGFPTNPQVINVAVSRAQTQLYIIADSKGLLESPMWNDIRKIWFDANNEYANNEYGKKNVKAERIIGTALSHRWNNLKTNRKIMSYTDRRNQHKLARARKISHFCMYKTRDHIVPRI